MESTTTDQQSFGAQASLSEPHFDEEATVLSARPVVPLTTIEGVEEQRVDAKTSFPRPWILGLALVGTLLIGIFATAMYYSRLDNNDSQLFDDEAAAGAEASTTTAEGFSGPAGNKPAVNVDSPSEVRNQTPAKPPAKVSAEGSRKPEPRLVAVITEKGNRSEADEESREELEERKAARRQARQERRRAERGARSPDDLLRIRDIFEGSPRP